MRTVVITPTLNEAGSIERHIDAVASAAPDCDVLIMDDDSPDRTWERASAAAVGRRGVHVVRRLANPGFRASYCEGFVWAIERGYDLAVMMDADGSHPADALPRLAEAAAENDFVVGSRYKDGIRVLNWSPGRLLLSLAGNAYARVISGVPATDLTSGYNAIRVDLLRRIGVKSLRYDGYAVQIELKFRAICAGARMTEVPIIFSERTMGRSKLSRHHVLEGITCPIALRFSSIFRRNPRR